ncbi:class I SAM-dependent methyltransferase [Flavihumibacter fluvii]|uniref:class I SAM-dependent methyltransferase n=1 Tax=Flavihumibacter fluvii TaxID=2838157 RepID=UPI001BDF5E16|nr:class I SAM-dependent methyltransferase [Flavihumibacter fluvii]ULQ53659.1 methyltransferase domain-containing protein [Flavihumibacter fluvii]
MSTGNWFREWFNSPYYHQLYFKRDEAEADKFINKLVQYLKPEPGATMLDVACGRGRHARSLAAMGYDVTGIDISADSIAEALQFEQEHLHFFVHDMRLPFRINYYQFAFNFFTSFGYFRTDREHYNTIRTIGQSLKPGGKLVMDFLNVHYAEDHLVHKYEEQIDGVNFYITKWFDETHFFKKVIIEDDNLEAPLEFMEKVAKFSLGDFNDMFSFHQLQIQEVFGDYDFSNYDVKKSPRMIMVARKIPG